MRQFRVVLLAKGDDAVAIRGAWQAEVNKRGKLDLTRCHTQTIDGKYAICRWDWMPLSSHDIYDLRNILESKNWGWQLIVIGDEAIGDVQEFICHPRFKLPVHLEAHVTVDLAEGEWVNPIRGLRKEAEQDRAWFDKQG